MSNDMFPEPLIKLMEQDAILAKSRHDAMKMQQFHYDRQLQEMERTYSIALDEVMQDILQQSPELRKHETVIRRMAMDTNPADLKGAINALKLAAEHVKRKLLEPPKGVARYLFIGGPVDGQWKALPEEKPTVAVAVADAAGVLDPNRMGPRFRNEMYRLKSVGANGSKVYVHESVEDADLMDYLLAGYKGAMENKYGVD